MTLEAVKEFRDKFKGKPFIITCDNQHYFYDNTEWDCPIIWDDAKETMTVITATRDQYGQSKTPICIKMTTYEHIQFMEALLTTSEALGFLQEVKGKLGDNAENKYEYCKEFISLAASNRMATPHQP